MHNRHMLLLASLVAMLLTSVSFAANIQGPRRSALQKLHRKVMPFEIGCCCAIVASRSRRRWVSLSTMPTGEMCSSVSTWPTT